MPLGTLNVGLIVGIAYKVFCMAADAMPPPPENASYGWRWFYDFMQKVATNTAKVGATVPFPLTQRQPLPAPTPVQDAETPVPPAPEGHPFKLGQ